MAESIFNDNSKDLWSKIVKVRNTNKIVSTCIDGVTGHIHIAELFYHKYNELCNSVRDEQPSLKINMVSKHTVLMMKIMIIYV